MNLSENIDNDDIKYKTGLITAYQPGYAVMGHSIMCHILAKYIIKRIDTTN